MARDGLMVCGGVWWHTWRESIDATIGSSLDRVGKLRNSVAEGVGPGGGGDGAPKVESSSPPPPLSPKVGFAGAGGRRAGA